ncbi:carbohydrate-binding domain-containing protein [Cryobacterium glaciale]|nr:carbohydrate-binding domain-containing protein [Cryobacterium glaciale]
MNGVDVSSSTTAAIAVTDADEVLVVLAGARP